MLLSAVAATALFVGSLAVSLVAQNAPELELPVGAIRRLGSLDLFHEGINGVAFTHGGTRLVTTGADGRVKVWDTQTAGRLDDFAPPGARITGPLSASADGSVLAFSRSHGGGATGAPEIWRDGERLRCPVDEAGIAVSADGTWAVTWSRDCELSGFVVGSDEVAVRTTLERVPTAVAFTPDARTIEVVYRVKSPEGLWGRRLQVRNARTLRILDDGTFVPTPRFDAPDDAFSEAHGTRVRVDEQRAVQVFSGALSLLTFEGDDPREVWRTDIARWMSQVAVSVDAGLIAHPGLSDSITLLDLAQGTPIFPMPGRHPGSVRHVAVSTESGLIVTAGDSGLGAFAVWHAESGELITFVETGDFEIVGIAFVSARSFVIASRVGTLSLWHIDETGGVLRLDGVDNPGGIDDMTSSSGGEFFATCRDDRVLLWSVVDDRLVERGAIPTRSRYVRNIAMSPDATRLAAHARDAEVFSVPDGELLTTFDVPGRLINPMAFTSDAAHVIVSEFGGLRWRDATTGSERRRIAQHHEVYRAMAVSDDGVLLSTLSDVSGSVTIRDAATGEVLRELSGFEGDVRDVAWWNGHPVTAMSSGTVLIWDR